MTLKQENGHFIIDKKTGVRITLGTIGIIMWLVWMVSTDRANAQQVILTNKAQIESIKQEYYRKEIADNQFIYLNERLSKIENAMIRIEDKIDGGK